MVVYHSSTSMNYAELGASTAEQFGKAIGPVHRQLGVYVRIREFLQFDGLIQRLYHPYRHGNLMPQKLLQVKLQSRHTLLESRPVFVWQIVKVIDLSSLVLLIIDYLLRYRQTSYIATPNCTVSRNQCFEGQIVTYYGGNTSEKQ